MAQDIYGRVLAGSGATDPNSGGGPQPPKPQPVKVDGQVWGQRPDGSFGWITVPSAYTNTGGGGGAAVSTYDPSAYLNSLSTQQAARQARFDQISTIFDTRAGELNDLKTQNLADLSNIASDADITRRAGEYKQSYLDQALPRFDLDRKKAFLGNRQRAAQRGVGDSSIYDDSRASIQRASNDALGSIQSRAFQLGSDKEAQDRGMLANVMSRILAANEADQSRLMQRRALALQEMFGGGKADLGVANLGVNADYRSSLLDQARNQFSSNDAYRWEALNNELAFKEWAIKAGLAAQTGASFNSSGPSFRG